MWFYNDCEFLAPPPGTVGFVYAITRKRDGRFYIGQKVFYNKVTKPPLKGKMLKRRSVADSDWKDYFGSSVELQADVLKEGRDGFHREILHLCRSKGEMNLVELEEQVSRQVMRDPMSYNGFIGKRISRSHVKGLAMRI